MSKSNSNMDAITKPLATLGRSVLFFAQILGSFRPDIKQLRAILGQVYFIGARSLVIIMISGFFVGMVLTLQSYVELSKFGATDSVGAVLALSLFRELGPVLTALLFSGRAGTSIAAEIGLMKATEQLSAMELMAIDPVKRVVVPRFIAGVISLPLLSMLFNLLAVAGGAAYAIYIMGIDSGIFWGNMIASVEFQSDFMMSFWKSLAFGIIASFIAVFSGYFTTPTGDGIGRATTQTVVVSAVAVLIVDFLITALMTWT